MRKLVVVLISFVLLLVQTGCTMTTTDGTNFTVVPPSVLETGDMAADEYYEGLFSGCVQSVIVSTGVKNLSPDTNQKIVRQCMVLTANAVKNDSHMSGVPGWPGLKKIRKVLKEIEDERSLDLLGATDM